MAGKWHKPGTRITAKFGGKDSKTGQRFEAGTLIECDKSGRGWFVVDVEYKPKPKLEPDPSPSVPNGFTPVPFGNVTRDNAQDTVYIKYANFAEFYTAAQRPQLPRNANHSREGSYSFCRTESWEQANEFAMNGDKEAISLVEKLRSDIKAGMGHAEPTVIRVRSIAGGRPNIAAYLSGEPENMYRYIGHVRDKGKIISIMADISFQASIPELQILMRGAAILALCDVLEEAGYRTEVYVGEAVTGTHYGLQPNGKYLPNWVMTVPLKTSTEYTDIVRLSYGLCNASMLRRHGFAIMENESPDLVGYSASHGYGKPWHGGVQKYLPCDIELSASYETMTSFDSVEKANKWIEAILEQQGIAYAVK